MLVLGTPQFPNHGVQLLNVLISTKGYHEESLTLRDDDYEGEPLGEQSHVLSVLIDLTVTLIHNWVAVLFGDNVSGESSSCRLSVFV